MLPIAEFTALLSPLPEPHLLCSASGEILASNPAAGQEFGIDPSATGCTLGALVRDPPERVEAYLRACSRTRHLSPGAFTIQRADGEEERFGCGGGLIRPAEDGTSALIMIRFRPHKASIPGFLLLNKRIEQLTRALHERRLAQKELQAYSMKLAEVASELERQKDEAQAANEGKSKFLAAMSHELRTPLNGVLGYVDLLDMELNGPITPEQRSQLDRIRRSTDHLITIINEILEYSELEAHLEPAELEMVDLVEVAQEAIEMIEPAFIEAGLEFVTDFAADQLIVRSDAVKLRQILLNLLSNAVKFTPEGSVRMTLRAEDDRVCVAVADTGIGIAAKDVNKIFDAFWQARPGQGGSGLGLPVTRELARRLGGEIEVESTPGEGSTFILVLSGVAS